MLVAYLQILEFFPNKSHYTNYLKSPEQSCNNYQIKDYLFIPNKAFWLIRLPLIITN